MSDRSTLQQTIIEYMDRDDIASIVPLFVSNAESVMWQDLVVRVMEKRWSVQAPTEPTASGGVNRFVDVPPRYIRMRRFHMITSVLSQLDPVPPEDMAKWWEPGRERPSKYCVQGTQIEFNKGFDSDYTLEMTFIQEPVSLGTAPTNEELQAGKFPPEWLDANGNAINNEVLDTLYHIYVERSMVEAKLWAKDTNGAMEWSAKYLGSVEKANARAKHSRTTGGTLIQRSDVGYP